MKDFIKEYRNKDYKLSLWQIIGVLCIIVVITGVFGWLYEFIFYYFNFDMKKFYWQGGNFLPWINIYATGSIMIILLTYKIRRSPFWVFVISFISTGVLEYFSGLGIYMLCDGLRLWDYNTEILNFGNIGGFVCLRSVMFFGVSALLLMYLILPICMYLSTKMNKKLFLLITISIFLIFMFDELYNLVIARAFGLPRARDMYEKIGINYMNFKKDI